MSAAWRRVEFRKEGSRWARPSLARARRRTDWRKAVDAPFFRAVARRARRRCDTDLAIDALLDERRGVP